MFDQLRSADNAALLAQLCGALTGMEQDTTDYIRIDRIRLLEELKSAVAAAQIRETAAFAASQRAEQIAAGVEAAKAGQGIAAQLGLARRLSPYHARQQLGWATILIAELPNTYAALQAGLCTEWRAMIVARETAWLSREDRLSADAELAPRLSGWGDRRVEAETKKVAYRLDPRGYVNRLAAAVSERRVSVRPAPDTMCRVTGLLPVAHGVAAYATLSKYADSLIAQGDARTRGQIMADTFYERLTGQTHAGDVPVEVELIMTDHTLFGDASFTDAFFTAADRADEDDAVAAEADFAQEDHVVPADHDPAYDHSSDADSADTSDPDDSPTPAAGSPAGHGSAGVDEPAYLVGYGWVPAVVARDLVLGARDTAPRWIRRLYTRPGNGPGSGKLIAMDSRRRCFTPAQRQFIRLRDQTCRTPFCDAPIRHTDHVEPSADGGPTSTDNGQGYCAACNYAKQAPGWTMTTPTGDAGDEVGITTPTGHRYTSRPPDPPGTIGTSSAMDTAPTANPHPAINEGRGSPLPQRAFELLSADQARQNAA